MRRERIAEPRIFAHVDEERGLRQRLYDLLAERVFVTYRHAERSAVRREQRLSGRAAAEVRHRNMQVIDQPAKERRPRKKFSERNQMLLTVTRSLRTDRVDAVVVRACARILFHGAD